MVHDFVDEIPTIDPAAERDRRRRPQRLRVLSDTLEILQRHDLLVDLSTRCPPTSGTATCSRATPRRSTTSSSRPALQAAGGPTYDVVHVNAEFGDQLSDHDPELLSLDFTPVPGGRFLATGPDRVLDTRLPGGKRLAPGEIGSVTVEACPRRHDRTGRPGDRGRPDAPTAGSRCSPAISPSRSHDDQLQGRQRRMGRSGDHRHRRRRDLCHHVRSRRPGRRHRRLPGRRRRWRGEPSGDRRVRADRPPPPGRHPRGSRRHPPRCRADHARRSDDDAGMAGRAGDRRRRSS